MIQNSYDINHDALYPGMVQQQQPHNFISKLNKTSSTIPYGRGLVTDGNDGAQLPLGTETDDSTFVGVTFYEMNRAQLPGSVAGQPAGYDMTLCPFGQVAVKTLVSVAKDDKVFLRVGATDTGDFSNVAGAAATLGVEITNAKFTHSAAAGDIVLVSFGIGG